MVSKDASKPFPNPKRKLFFLTTTICSNLQTSNFQTRESHSYLHKSESTQKKNSINELSMNLRLLAREWQTTPSSAWKIPWSFLQLCRPSNAATNQIVTVLGFQSGGFVLILQSSGRCSPPFGSVPPKGIWRLKWNKSCAGFTSSCSKRRRGNWVTNELMMFLFTHVCF